VAKATPKTRPDESLRIITDVTWNAAHERLKASAAHYTFRKPDGTLDGRPETTSRYLLAGFLKCGECGGSFYAHHHATSPAFRCSWRHRRGATVCGNSRSLPVRETDAAILDLIQGELLTENAVERTLAHEASEPEIIEVEKAAAIAQRDDAQKEMEKGVGLIIKGLVLEDDMASVLKSARAHKADAEARLTALDNKVQAFKLDRDAIRTTMIDWKDKLSAEPVIARQVLKRLIKGRITVNPDGSFDGTSVYGPLFGLKPGPITAMTVGLAPAVMPPASGLGSILSVKLGPLEANDIEDQQGASRGPPHSPNERQPLACELPRAPTAMRSSRAASHLDPSRRPRSVSATAFFCRTTLTEEP
jgi:hypothetical protein